MIPLYSDRTAVVYTNERAPGGAVLGKQGVSGEHGRRARVTLPGDCECDYSNRFERTTSPTQRWRASARSHCGARGNRQPPFEMLLSLIVPLLLAAKGALGQPFIPTSTAALISMIDDCMDDYSGDHKGVCKHVLHEYGRAENGEWVSTVNDFDVSKVTSLDAVFKDLRHKFNQPLGAWNVSKVTTMREMFKGSYTSGHKFDQALAEWDVSSVTDMYHMFHGYSSVRGSSFNHPLEAWNVFKVEKMEGMFAYAFEFNQPLEGWDVSSATNMRTMFFYANKFNQPLNAWDVSRVTKIDKSECHIFCVQ